MMNGVSGSDSDGYNHWSEMKPAQPKSLSPPQPQKQLSDSYSNTLPVRKNVAPKNSYASGEAPALLRGPGASSATGELWGTGWGWTLGMDTASPRCQVLLVPLGVRKCWSWALPCGFTGFPAGKPCGIWHGEPAPSAMAAG